VVFSEWPRKQTEKLTFLADQNSLIIPVANTSKMTNAPIFPVVKKDVTPLEKPHSSNYEY